MRSWGGRKCKRVRTDTLEPSLKHRPVGFKNDLERLKYEHNHQMLQRNRYWTYGQVVVGGLLGWFLFYIVPKWNAAEEIKQYGNSVATFEIGLGVVVVLIIPFLLKI